MFVIIYRWRLHPGREAAFERAWAQLTELFKQLRGGLGSRLHRTDSGLYIAYAQWPDRETYLLSAERGVPDETLAARMNAAVAERLEPEFMETVHDLLESES
jgi:hypothetical protein